jgi:hypothetical protein
MATIMSNRSSLPRRFRVILALFAFLTASAAVKHFVSSQFGYELDVPTGWNVDQTPSGVPVLFNYESSMAGPQGLFPEKGAEVRVIPFETVQIVMHARTMDEWITHNYGAAYRNVSQRKLPDVGASLKEPQNITEVQADFERDSQDEELQHDLSYYFTLNGAAFRLRLLYWRDNPHRAELETVCKSVLRSIRAR